MKKIMMLVATLMVALGLAACSSSAPTITKGVNKNNVAKLDSYGEFTVHIEAPAKAHYIVAVSDGSVDDTVTVSKSDKAVYSEYGDSDGKTKVTLYATTKKYKYGTAKSKIDYLSKTTFTVPRDTSEDDSDSDDDDDTSSDSESTDDSTDSTADESSASSSSEVNTADYSTSITYDQLARTPDDYDGEKVAMTGEVAQVIDGDDSTQVRVAINGDYDTVVLIEFDNSVMGGSRVLEDDLITFYGISMSTVTYKSTMGGKITIPYLLVNKINDQGTASDDYGY